MLNLGADFPIGIWTHAMITYDGAGSVKLYVNGVERASRNDFFMTGQSSAPFKIATSGTCSSSQTFPGALDEVQFYDRALAPEEVASLGAPDSIVVNGSFESSTINPGSFTTIGVSNPAIHSWLVLSGNIDYIGTLWSASDGVRSIDMDGFRAGSIGQSIVTAIGAQYEVRFDMAGNTGGAPTVKTLEVSAGDQSELFNFDTTGRSPTNMGWEERLFVFTATSSVTTITFTSRTGGRFFGAAIDNVRVTRLPPGG